MDNISPPTKEDVRAARRAAQMTQSEAAKIVHLGSLQRWAEYESGGRNIDLSRWELFLIKTDQHPEYKKRTKPRRAKAAADPLDELVPM